MVWKRFYGCVRQIYAALFTVNENGGSKRHRHQHHCVTINLSFNSLWRTVSLSNLYPNYPGQNRNLKLKSNERSRAVRKTDFLVGGQTLPHRTRARVCSIIAKRINYSDAFWLLLLDVISFFSNVTILPIYSLQRIIIQITFEMNEIKRFPPLTKGWERHRMSNVMH